MRLATDLTTRNTPARFAGRTLDDYVPGTPSQATALEAARKLSSAEYRSLVLVGPPGVGKSHLAAGIVNEIIDGLTTDYQRRKAEADAMPIDKYRHPEIPLTPMWTNVADLIVGLRMEMNAPADDRDAERAVRILRRHPALVVLDDLGREKASDWTGEIVYALVNSRYENRLPTLVTSNLSPGDLAASPYWPVISRLAEDGELVKIDGPDARLGRS